MKKKQVNLKKLVLTKETIVELNFSLQNEVKGGAWETVVRETALLPAQGPGPIVCMSCAPTIQQNCATAFTACPPTQTGC